jgi:predicted metal-dependent phosphoesterase TrpH
MTRFDLHIHSALSACAENTLSPGRIVERASQAGISLLALTDHNASANVAPTMEAGQRRGVGVIPGVEVMTREEVHVLVFFDDVAALADWQTLLDAALPEASNRPEFFGEQIVYDAADGIIGIDERLRQVGIGMGLDAIAAEVHARGGVVIPAHVFRGRHSLTSQLGFIDPGGAYDALEVTTAEWRREGYQLGQRLRGFPAVTGSDTHFLEDVGRSWLEIGAAASTAGALLDAIRRLAG